MNERHARPRLPRERQQPIQRHSPEISGNIGRKPKNRRRKGPTRRAIFGKVIVYARVIA
jgi:hypothetical protein